MTKWEKKGKKQTLTWLCGKQENKYNSTSFQQSEEVLTCCSYAAVLTFFLNWDKVVHVRVECKINKDSDIINDSNSIADILN